MTTQTNGPAELRRISFWHPVLSDELKQLAEQWDADRAALERARALAEEWAAKKYAGDLTTAVYHGCADELAAALGEGGRP